MIKAGLILFCGVLLVSGLAWAQNEIKISEFQLMTMATKKMGKDKVSQEVVIQSVGQTDLVYIAEGEAPDALAQLMLKTALSEVRAGVYEVRYVLAIAFSPSRWKTQKGDVGEIESVFEVRKDDLSGIEKLDAVQQSAELASKGVEHLRRLGYSHLKPEFTTLFNSKIYDFVWSMRQQLPEMVIKLIELYPEARKSAA